VEELAAAAAKRKEEEAKSASPPIHEPEKASAEKVLSNESFVERKSKVEELAAAANKRKEEEENKAAAQKSPQSGLLEKSPGKSAAEGQEKQLSAAEAKAEADEKVTQTQHLFDTT